MECGCLQQLLDLLGHSTATVYFPFLCEDFAVKIQVFWNNLGSSEADWGEYVLGNHHDQVGAFFISSATPGYF